MLSGAFGNSPLGLSSAPAGPMLGEKSVPLRLLQVNLSPKPNTRTGSFKKVKAPHKNNRTPSKQSHARDQELLGKLCYKKCSLLTDGKACWEWLIRDQRIGLTENTPRRCRVSCGSSGQGLPNIFYFSFRD